MSNYANWARHIFWACVEYDTDLSDAIHEAADGAEDVIYTASAWEIYSEHGEHGDFEVGNCASIDHALMINAYLHICDLLWAEMPCLSESPREMIDERICECLDDREAACGPITHECAPTDADWDCIVDGLDSTGSEARRIVMARWNALVNERAE